MQRWLVLVLAAGCARQEPSSAIEPAPQPSLTVAAADAAVSTDAAMARQDAAAVAVAVDLARCSQSAVDGVAKGMSFDCDAFSLRDLTAPERIPIDQLIHTMRDTSRAAGATVTAHGLTIPGAEAAALLEHVDPRVGVSLDVIAMYDIAGHTRIVVCSVPWMAAGSRPQREADCLAGIASRLAAPAYSARKLSRVCKKAAAHLEALVAAVPGSRDMRLIAVDFLVTCTDRLGACVVKAATPDAVIECEARHGPR